MEDSDLLLTEISVTSAGRRCSLKWRSMEFFYCTVISVHQSEKRALWAFSSSNEKLQLSSFSLTVQSDGQHNPPKQILVSSGRSYSWDWPFPSDEVASWLKFCVRNSQMLAPLLINQYCSRQKKYLESNCPVFIWFVSFSLPKRMSSSQNTPLGLIN